MDGYSYNPGEVCTQTMVYPLQNQPIMLASTHMCVPRPQYTHPITNATTKHVHCPH